MKKRKKLDIIQARVRAGFTVNKAAYELEPMTPNELRMYERRLRPFSELGRGFKKLVAITYGCEVDDIEWRDYRVADVTIASYYLDVDTRVMKKYLKQGDYGYATTEDGVNYEYHVDLDLAEKVGDTKAFQTGIKKGIYGRYDSNAE